MYMHCCAPVLHSPCGAEEGLGVLEVVEVSLVLEIVDGLSVVDGLQSPIIEVVDGWLELEVEGRIVHEVVGGSAAAVLVLLTTRHCCWLQLLPVFSSTGDDKSDGTIDMPVSTSTL